MREYSVDDIIKLSHSPVINSTATSVNKVGATDSETMRSLGFTPSDTNSIYVSKAGNDTTAVGTEADPVLTIDNANDLITATKTHIVILDSGTYEEPYIDFDANLAGIYAALGETPKLKPSQTINSDNYTVDAIETGEISNMDCSYLSCHALSNGEFLYISTTGYRVTGTSAMEMQKVDKDGNKNGGAYPAPEGSNINDYVCYAIDNGFIVAYLNSRVYCYNNDMSVRWSQVFAYSSQGLQCMGDFGDDSIIIYYGVEYNNVGYVVISKEDGSEVVSQSSLGDDTMTVAAGEHVYGSHVPYDGGSISIHLEAFSAAGAVNIFKVNASGVLVASQLLYNSGLDNSTSGNDDPFANSYSFVNSCMINDSGELVIVYHKSDGVYYMVLDPSDFSTITSETLIKTVSYSPIPLSRTNIHQSWNGTYIISFTRGWNGYLYVYTNDFTTILYSDEASTDGIGNGGAYSDVLDRYLTVSFRGGTTANVYGVILTGFVWDWWVTFQSDIEFNGIIFDGEDVDGMSTMIDTNLSTDTTIKWCTFQNTSRIDYKDVVAHPLVLMKSTAASNTISNVLVKDNDTGLEFGSNNVSISYSQFYRLLAASAYALHINGAAAASGDITVNHCDIFNCSKGVYFSYNNGSNEVLKNSIIHQCAGYGIIADTEITFNNCVNTCDTSGAAEGTKVVNLNPMYINEGAIDPDDIDLNLKIRAIGYPITSPAYLLADDSENAGSLLVDYTYEETSRTTIQLPKPRISIDYQAVNPVKHTAPDGSDTFYYDALREIIVLAWGSLLKDDFDTVLAMCNFRGTDKLVYLYLEPTTEPVSYLETTLSWAELPGSPEYPVQSDLGVNRSITITLTRPYPEAS